MRAPTRYRLNPLAALLLLFALNAQTEGPADPVDAPTPAPPVMGEEPSGCACRRSEVPADEPAAAAPPADPDPDQDGLLADADQCPTDAEDKDNYADDDGCPELDNDNDTIADVSDRCPLVAENLNGYEDTDGCPDSGKVVVESKSTPPPPVETKPTVTAAPVQVEPTRSSGKATAQGAQQQWVIAVMNVEARVDKVLTTSMLRSLTDQTRVFLAVRKMKVVDKGSMEAAMREMVEMEKKKSYAACVDTSCQIPLGKALSGTHILRLSVARFDAICTLNGELIDLKTEVTVAAATGRSPCRATDLLDASEKLADQLIRDSVN